MIPQFYAEIKKNCGLKPQKFKDGRYITEKNMKIHRHWESTDDGGSAILIMLLEVPAP